MALVGLLLVAVSVVLYYSFAANIRSNVEGNFASDQAQSDFVAGTVGHMRDQILLIDGVVLLCTAGAGFVLARRTLRPIRRNLEEQKRFVSNASHDLRTPLAVMKANLEVALRYETGEGAHAIAVESSLDEVEHMSRLVEDMLTLSRIDARQEELRFSVVDVAELIARIVEKMQPLAGGEGVRLSLAAEGDLNARCDADHLERALVNVLRNAVQHSDPGGAVEIGVHRLPDRVGVVVSDSGAGIGADDLPHVFERHYRAGSDRSRERGGSGLGLAITQWIIQRHGGTIEVASVLGEGTTVTVRLPMAGPS